MSSILAIPVDVKDWEFFSEINLNVSGEADYISPENKKRKFCIFKQKL